MNPPGRLRSDGLPDMRYSCNRAWASSTGTCVPLTTGGTYSSSSWNSNSGLRNETLAANAPARLRKDNKPDMRYRENKDYVKKTGMQVETTTKKTSQPASASSSSGAFSCAKNEAATYNNVSWLLPVYSPPSYNPPSSALEREREENEKLQMKLLQFEKVLMKLEKENENLRQLVQTNVKSASSTASSTLKTSSSSIASASSRSERGHSSSLPQGSSNDMEKLKKKLAQLESDIARLNAQNAELKTQKATLTEKESNELCSSLQQLQLGGVEELSGEAIRAVTSDFKNRIAEGGFSHVYKGTWRKCEVAVKVLRFGDRDDLKLALKCLNREVQVLARLDHPHIVKLLAVCKSTDAVKPSPALVFSYANAGTLFQAIFDKESKIDLSVETMVRVSLHVARALEYLHSFSEQGRVLVHRDVKSANILLEMKDRRVKALLADFGITRFTQSLTEESESKARSSVTAVVGTKGYVDPVYAETYRVEPSMDIYAYGVVLFEMLWRERPDNPDVLVARNARLMSVEKCVEKAVAKNASENKKVLEMINRLVSIAKGCVRTDDVKMRPTAEDIANQLGFLQ